MPLGHLFGFRAPDGLVAPTPSSRNEDGPDDDNIVTAAAGAPSPALVAEPTFRDRCRRSGLYGVLAAIQPSPVVELNRDPRPHAGREMVARLAPILRKAGFTRVETVAARYRSFAFIRAR